LSKFKNIILKNLSKQKKNRQSKEYGLNLIGKQKKRVKLQKKINLKDKKKISGVKFKRHINFINYSRLKKS
jgi:hypothetical protein